MAIQLRGLTAQDRADWEKKYQAWIMDNPDVDLDRRFNDNMFRNKFRNNFQTEEEYIAFRDSKSPEERDAYYNSIYDEEQQKLTDQQLSQSVNDSMLLGRDAVLEANSIQQLNTIEQQFGETQYASLIEEMGKSSEALQEAKNRYIRDYNMDYRKGKAAISTINEIAAKNSPWYRRYAGSEYLNLSNEDWTNLSAEYNALKDQYGEGYANQKLDNKIQGIIAENTPWYEYYPNAFMGVGAQATSLVVLLLTEIYAAFEARIDQATGRRETIDTGNGFRDYWLNLSDAWGDNRATRFSSDVSEYGSLVYAAREHLFNGEENPYKKEGLSRLANPKKEEWISGSVEQRIFNKGFIPELINQHGFTAGTMLAGGVEAKLAQGFFTQYRNFKIAQELSRTGMYTQQLATSMERLRKAEVAFNKFFIPASVGTLEGLVEGYHTKQEILTEGYNMLKQEQAQAVDKDFQSLLESEYADTYFQIKQLNQDLPTEVIQEMSFDMLYQKAWKQNEDKYAEMEKQIMYNAVHGGGTNLIINSVINGAINSTLKNTLFSPETTSILRNTKLGTKLLDNKVGRFITGNYGNITISNGKATPNMPWYKLGWGLVKEPLGEGMEEFSQEMSNALEVGMAQNNLKLFADNTFRGDGSLMVGERWGSDLAAGLSYAGKKAQSTDTKMAFIQGALTSVLGGVHINTRYTKGNAVDKEGNIKRDEKGNPIRTYFGRIQRADGKAETNAQMFWRIASEVTPWRSGSISQISEFRAQKEQLQAEADHINAWLSKPENQEKLKGVQGAFNWSYQMHQAQAAGDEFEYRNSKLGKIVNDILILESIKDTETGKAFMKNLYDAANAELGSREAQDAIAYFRKNIATKNEAEGKSDQEILDILKKNANQAISMYQQVTETKAKYQEVLGDAVDPDLMNALVYSSLQNKDWTTRLQQLNEELSKIQVESSKNNSSLSDKAKYLLATLSRINPDISKIPGDMARKLAFLKGMKKRAPELGLLIDDQIRELKSEATRVKGVKDVSGDIVLNEQEIMSLDPYARWQMLSDETRKNVSKEQQEIIDRVIQQGMAADPKFKKKIEDAGKIAKSLEENTKQYVNALTDPFKYNLYIQNAKRAARQEGYQKRYQALARIRDYEDFVQQMDILMSQGTQEEQEAIINYFNNQKNDFIQPHYNRYVQEKEELRQTFNILASLESVKNTSKEENELLARALNYAKQKGANLKNADEIVSTILADEGNEFVKYLQSVGVDVNNLDLGFIADYIKEVIPVVNGEIQNSKELKQEPIASNTPSNTPVGTVTPEVSLMSTQEQDTEQKEQEEEVVEQKYSKLFSSILEEAKKENTEIQEFINTILEEFDSTVNTEEEYLNGLIEQVQNNQDQYNDNQKAAINLIYKKLNPNKVKTQIQNPTSEQLAKTTKGQNVTDKGPSEKANSSTMETVNISFLKRRYKTDKQDKKYSPQLAYIVQHNVEEFLGKGTLTKDTPVYFLYDKKLGEDSKKVRQSLNIPYSDPIVAVVESEQGTITIGGKKYQPIGILHKEGTDKLGSNVTGKLVKLKQGEETQLISIDGKPIETRLNNAKVISTINFVNDTSALSQTLTEQGINRPTTIEGWKPVFQKLFPNIAKESSKDGSGHKLLVFKRKELKDQGKEQNVNLYTRKVKDTTSRNGNNIVQLAAEQSDEILTANSRIEGFLRVIDTIVERTNQFDYSKLVATKAGVLTTDSNIEELKKSIQKALSQYVTLSKGNSYQLDLVGNEDGTVSINLSIVDEENNKYELGQIATPSHKLSNEEKKQMLQYLFADGGALQFINWGVPYKDMEEAASFYKNGERGSLNPAIRNAQDIVMDDILYTTDGNMYRSIQGVEIQSPFSSDGQVISRNSGATGTGSINTSPQGDTKTADNVVVDSITGEVIQGTPKSQEGALLQQAKRVADQIVADSQNIQLAEDEEAYELNGTRYVRVTSVISEKEFDKDSPYYIPSTNIGTGIDELTRDIISGRITKDSQGNYVVEGVLVEQVYPNGTKKAFANYIDAVLRWKQTMVNKGYTFISRDVTVNGTIDVTTSDGNTIQVNVAGTVDLLAYDSQGNWHLFDMKTYRSKMDANKKKKYARQLTLYKQLLEKKYGIQVNTMSILPIHVEYSDATRYETSQESKHEKYNGRQNNQLIYNKSMKFDGSRPRLDLTIPVSPVENPMSEEAIKRELEKLINSKDESASNHNQTTGEVKVEKVATPESNTNTQDMIDATLGDLLGIDMSTINMGQGEEHIPARLRWGVLEGFSDSENVGRQLNKDATMEALQKLYTEEQYNNMSNIQKEQAIKCNAVWL